MTSSDRFSSAAPLTDRPWPRAMAASMDVFGKPAVESVSICRKLEWQSLYPVIYLSSRLPTLMLVWDLWLDLLHRLWVISRGNKTANIENVGTF